MCWHSIEREVSMSRQTSAGEKCQGHGNHLHWQHTVFKMLASSSLELFEGCRTDSRATASNTSNDDKDVTLTNFMFQWISQHRQLECLWNVMIYFKWKYTVAIDIQTEIKSVPTMLLMTTCGFQCQEHLMSIIWPMPVLQAHSSLGRCMPKDAQYLA